MMSTLQLMQQWYDEVWNKGNASFIDVMMDKNVIVHGLDPSGRSEGIEQFKTFYGNFRKSFPVTKINLQSLVYDNEFATVYCTVSGKSSTNREVVFNGLCVAKFKDGKLIEGWNNFDFLKMYQQLGHILVSEISEA